MTARMIFGALSLALAVAAPADAAGPPVEREYRILFYEGSADLRNGAVIARQAADFGRGIAEPTFHVVGHSTQGEPERVAEARAKAVSDALVDMGVARRSLVTRSAGAAEPDAQYPQYSGRVIITVRG